MRMRVPHCASICLFAAAFVLATAGESNAQRLTPGMLCSWSHLHAQGSSVNAQSQFAPYYGKNQIHYDKFEWHIYKTDHFEIYYYPENERHLERVASYAESAYQQVSSDLRHDLNQRVPLIIFKTHSEFEQQNIAPGRRAGRGARVCRRRAQPHGAADRSAVGLALRADRPRADARLPVRLHSRCRCSAATFRCGCTKAARNTSAASGIRST